MGASSNSTAPELGNDNRGEETRSEPMTPVAAPPQPDRPMPGQTPADTAEMAPQTGEDVDEEPLPEEEGPEDRSADTVDTLPEGDGAGESTPLSCAEIIDCLGVCGADQMCGQGCVQDGSDEGRRLINELVLCLQESGCVDEDAECQEVACAPELQACADPLIAPLEPPEEDVGEGQGVICCGNDGDVCDLDTEYCCSNWFGAECKPECDANLDLTQTCDGAEDCDGEQVCCAAPDAILETSLTATCRDACNAGEVVLNEGLAGQLPVGGDGLDNPIPEDDPAGAADPELAEGEEDEGPEEEPGAAGDLVPFTTAEVQELFNLQCGPACHSGGILGNPNLRDVLSAVDENSPVEGIPQTTRGDRNASYVYLKTAGTHVEAGGFGAQMPIGRPLLDEVTIERIGLWNDNL
jgi:hypothetical protein